MLKRKTVKCCFNCEHYSKPDERCCLDYALSANDNVCKEHIYKQHHQHGGTNGSYKRIY